MQRGADNKWALHVNNGAHNAPSLTRCVTVRTGGAMYVCTVMRLRSF